MSTINKQSAILKTALSELESKGSLSTDTSQALLTVGGLTDGVKKYVEHVRATRGELIPQDFVTIAVLTQPIPVEFNPRLQKALNVIRESGEITPESADEVFNSIGKLSKDENEKLGILLHAMSASGTVDADVMQDMIDRRQTFLDRRQADTAGFHKSIQAKTWGTFIAAAAAFFGVLNIPGAGEMAQTIAMDHEIVGSLLHMSLGLASAWGAGSGARRVMDPGGDLAAIETYGIRDLEELLMTVAEKHGGGLEENQQIVADGMVALFKDAGMKVPRRKDLGTLERHALKNWATLSEHLATHLNDTPEDPAHAKVLDAIRERWT